VDPRGAGAVVDARGAVEEIPDAYRVCGALLAARDKTQQDLSSLRERVDITRLPDRSALVLFGSWGRYELTSESDDDWGLLLDDADLNLDGPRVADALLYLRGVFAEEKAPGRQAYFGCAFHAAPLSERIGLDEDDTRNLTRRMLLLLESVPVTGADVHRGVQDRILSRYFAYHRRGFRPPRFLLNDIIRYWRTICVDFEGKTAQDRRERAEKDKFVTRNAKLRTSRKMLYASGLLPALLCHFVDSRDIETYMRSQMDAVATDRVARAFLHLDQRDPGGRVIAAYSDWIDLIGDPEKRSELDGLERKGRRRSRTFKEVQRIGDVLDNGLTALLFESSLGEVARKFAVL
jgi:hypothetical protein